MTLVRKILFTFFLLGLLMIQGSFVYAVDQLTYGDTVKLQECFDEKLNIKIFCNQDWELESTDDTFMMIVENDPSITVTVTRTFGDFKSLTQLNRNVLQVLGGYNEGFRMQTTQIDGNEALEVVGFHKDQTDIYLRDYYFIKNDTLYSVLFAIQPKRQWMNYYALVKRIINSVEVIDLL